MAGREPRAARAAAAPLILGLGLACACSQAPPVQRVEEPAAQAAASEAAPAPAPAAAEGTPAAEASAPAPAAPAPAPASAPAASAPATAPAASNPPTYLPLPAEGGPKDIAGRPGVVVLDPGEESRPKTLVEAARAERERKAHAGKPVAVITDKTLPSLATGQLTYAQPKPAAADKAAAPAGAASVKDEAYWRGRAREIRGRWRDAVEEAERLEQSAADLRRRFYTEDDPYRRDVQIKPEWDRALDLLARKREEAKAGERELTAFLDEGRREGALPGWLREGSELEPPPSPGAARPGEAAEPPELNDHAIEPPELDEEPPR